MESEFKFVLIMLIRILILNFFHKRMRMSEVERVYQLEWMRTFPIWICKLRRCIQEQLGHRWQFFSIRPFFCKFCCSFRRFSKCLPINSSPPHSRRVLNSTINNSKKLENKFDKENESVPPAKEKWKIAIPWGYRRDRCKKNLVRMSLRRNRTRRRSCRCCCHWSSCSGDGRISRRRRTIVSRCCLQWSFGPFYPSRRSSAQIQAAPAPYCHLSLLRSTVSQQLMKSSEHCWTGGQIDASAAISTPAASRCRAGSHRSAGFSSEKAFLLTTNYFKITNKFLQQNFNGSKQKIQSRIYCFEFCLIFLSHIDSTPQHPITTKSHEYNKRSQNKIAQQYLLQKETKRGKETSVRAFRETRDGGGRKREHCACMGRKRNSSPVIAFSGEAIVAGGEILCFWCVASLCFFQMNWFFSSFYVLRNEWARILYSKAELNRWGPECHVLSFHSWIIQNSWAMIECDERRCIFFCS